MPTINCSVESCVYNKEKICEAEILQIGGKGANWTESTCCETYRDSDDVHNNVTEAGETEEILCKVETCDYNVNKHCSLSEIEVSSHGDVSDYTETDCLSFERKAL